MVADRRPIGGPVGILLVTLLAVPAARVRAQDSAADDGTTDDGSAGDGSAGDGSASSDGAAGGASGTRLYVVASAAEPELETVAARVGAAARAALRNQPEVDWRAPDQRFSGYQPEALETLARARASLEEGRAAYVDLRLEDAIEALTTAVRSFDEAAAALEDPEDLGEALLLLGASQQFDGRTRAARITFRRLHVQMPQVAPDPQVYPPDVVEAFGQAAPRGAAAGALQVGSQPPGALVYVDFVPRGETPLAIEDLPRGEHVLRIVRPGAPPYVEETSLGRGARSVEAMLVEAPEGEGIADAVSRIPGADLHRIGPDDPIGELAAILQLSTVGVIRVRYGDSDDMVGLELVMFDATDGRRLLRREATAPRTLGGLEATVSELVAEAVNGVLHPPEAPVAAPAQPRPDLLATTAAAEEAPPRKRGWIWGVVGTVVAIGAVVGIVFATRGEERDLDGQVVFEF